MDGRRVGGLTTAVGLLLLVSSAQAGPVISWGYTSTLEPVGGVGYEGLVTTLQSIHYQYVSRVSGETGGTEYGWQTVQVGSITPTDGGGDPLAKIATSYRLTLNLTDAASGEAGTVTYTGRADENAVWEGDAPFQYPISRHAYVFGLEPEGDETVTLGGYEYRVTLTARANADGTAAIDATIRVGEMQATPEPGTLVLAGVGLAGMVGAWVRRKGRLVAVATAA